MGTDGRAPLAAVFDYGGVMTLPMSSVTSTFGSTGPSGGLDPAAVGRVFATVMAHDDPDSAWAQVERGEITLDEFTAVLDGHLPGLSTLFRDPDSLPPARLQVRADMVERVRRIRSRGVRTALCTNNIAEFRPIWSAKLDLAALFDHVVDSSAIGMRKPELRMYAHVAATLGVDPGDTVFVDDLRENVEAAAAAGFRTLLVGEDDAHLAALDALFGL